MEFLFVCLLLATSAASPLADHNSSSEASVENDTHVTDSSAPMSGIMMRDVIYSSPALVFVGSQDKLLRCRHDSPTECEVWFEGINSTPGSLLISGAYIYAGLYSGVIKKCNIYQKESCQDFYNGDSPVESLLITNGYLFAGLYNYNGTILRCQLHEPSNCQQFHYVNSPVFSLIQYNDYIVAGLKDGRMMRCVIEEERSCTSLFEGSDTSVMGIVIVGNTVLTTTYDGWLYKCSRSKFKSIDHERKYKINKYPRDLAVFNEGVYIPEKKKKVTVCKLTNLTDCSDYGNFETPWSIAFAYGAYYINRSYSTTSIHLGSSLIASQDHTDLEVRVVKGKLYTSKGLLDTSYYDRSLAGAQNFVMKPDGTILVSKSISSLFSGKLVSSAGEMVVRDGVIEEMSTCLEHFVDLNQQVITSLNVQGYAYPIRHSNTCVVRITDENTDY